MRKFKIFLLVLMTNIIAGEISKMPSLPDPVYSVNIRKSQMVPMRDNIRLSTDLYVPEKIEGELPVILIRTPYNKNTFRINDFFKLI